MKKYLYLIIIVVLFNASCKHEKTIHPVFKNIVETVYASGFVLPESEYKVFALSNGIITEKKVRDGDSIAAGGIVYVVNNESQSAVLAAAQTAYNNAAVNLSNSSPLLNDLRLIIQNAATKLVNDSLNFIRYANLLKEDAVSKTTYDNAKLAYTISLNQKKSADERIIAAKNDLQLALTTAQSQLTAAKEGLNNYYIKSDSSGTVFQTFKEKGEAVRAGELMALLGKKRKRIIRLSVDQQDIDKIQIGQVALLKIDVTTDKIYTAHISMIYPVMNEGDQTFRVDAMLPDSVAMPYIHSSVEANIIIQKKEHILIIPRSVLIGEDSVRIKTASEKKSVQIKTGIMTLDDVEILSGIDENTEIVCTSVSN